MWYIKKKSRRVNGAPSFLTREREWELVPRSRGQLARCRYIQKLFVSSDRAEAYAEAKALCEEGNSRVVVCNGVIY